MEGEEFILPEIGIGIAYSIPNMHECCDQVRGRFANRGWASHLLRTEGRIPSDDVDIILIWTSHHFHRTHRRIPSDGAYSAACMSCHVREMILVLRPWGEGNWPSTGC
jgi:hypothetical protein